MPSAHSVLKQRVGVTDVEIDYSRPDKNGRDIFGTLVPFGTVWRTGANAATTITLSDTVNLGGKDIPAGKYALFTIPGADQWTIILSKHADQFGAFDYKESEDLARFTAKPATLAAPVETFTIGLADVKENSAQLQLEWDRTCVSVPLTVDTTGKIQAEITRIAASPDATPRFYTQAANYYLNHHLDLSKALEWINLSIEKTSPVYFGNYAVKADIQAALGGQTRRARLGPESPRTRAGRPGTRQHVHQAADRTGQQLPVSSRVRITCRKSGRPRRPGPGRCSRAR